MFASFVLRKDTLLHWRSGSFTYVWRLYLDLDVVKDMTSKPTILPDTFSGDHSASWDQWIIHFSNCSEVNGWTNDAKLAFLKVRLTGRAQSVFQRLTADEKSSFTRAIEALKTRFSKRELYLAELSTRKRTVSENWSDFAEDLRRLSAKAYPDLGSEATEQIALTHFLANITDRQVSFAVKQKAPTTLDDAVTATIQFESYLTTFNSPREDVSASAVTHANDQNLMLLVEQLSDKLSN